MPSLSISAISWDRVATRFGLLMAALAMISPLTFADPDMFHALALIREAVATGQLPTQDVFAYTPTVEPFVHHEWGAGAILYGLLVMGGLGPLGLIALKYLVSLGVMAGCWLGARRQGADERVLIVLAPLALLLGWIGFTTIRAQLYSMLFLVVLLLCLQIDRRGRRWWVGLWLPAFTAWLNVHGGFVAGVGVLLLYTGEQFARTWWEDRDVRRTLARQGHLLGTLAMMALLTNVNPYGPTLLPQLLGALQLDRPRIIEWGPLWTSPQPFVPLLTYGISVVLLGYAIVTRGWSRLPGLPIVLVTAWLALQHIRHGSLYAITWFFFVPAYLEPSGLTEFVERFWTRYRRLVAACGVAVGLLCLATAVNHRFWELKLPAQQPMGPLIYPVGAVDYLKQTGFRGNVMTTFHSGAYVSWKLYPQVRVSFDSRYEAAYPPEALDENFDFYAASPGWQDTLKRYATDAVLVPRHGPLAEEFRQLPDWHVVYEDDGFLVALRDGLENRYPVRDCRGELLRPQFP